DSLTISVELVNRSSFPVKLQQIRYSISLADSLVQTDLQDNRVLNFKKKFILTDNLPLSQPYWLNEEGTIGMFKVDNKDLIGKPENNPAIKIFFDLMVGDQKFSLERPVVYKKTDPVAGEQYRHLEIIPPVFINLKEQVFMFASDDQQVLELGIRAGKANVKGDVKLKLAEGWKSEPDSHPITLSTKGEEVSVFFNLFPPANNRIDVITASVSLEGQSFNKGYHSISYTHIPNQLLLPEANIKAGRLDIQKRGQNIGYIMGAGDEVPSSLRQIGYKVTILNDGDITVNNLKKYDAVILGIRAYNTVNSLKFYQSTLFEYVNQGGNMIVQFNTSGGLLTNDIAPYPLKISRDRVAVEDAPVRFLQPDHPVLNKPNKISSDDFEGWVQERGLYFAGEWDQNFQAILSMNDPGEDPKEGSLLIAQHGKGFYIYTGLALFRQLSAGVPGAYRLFANLISLEKEPKQ
ncbi:MAG: LmbE family protein, partial [Bacteroidota bacterium]|nr:LmbE family protein [Bacteroidota bacterium]